MLSLSFIHAPKAKFALLFRFFSITGYPGHNYPFFPSYPSLSLQAKHTTAAITESPFPSHELTLLSTSPKKHTQRNRKKKPSILIFTHKTMLSRFAPRFPLYFLIYATASKPLIGANHTSSRFCSR